ncbi:uncharacterized protein DNG_03493 [Cephalotrichum gorgonifer]|uniref:Uncharacterized protein n=1 Tax=Cephalotrichum gorgonifer TaxID=2041049 RepID=A0AAE8MX44_9PEZI|nr:uncharacterized protein DNG_03493 [Cephalotrichum gorgonifer]
MVRIVKQTSRHVSGWGRSGGSGGKGGGNSSKGGGSSSKRGGGGSTSSGYPSLSFLFVVVKLKVVYLQQPECDSWGNVSPPTDYDHYTHGEDPSRVMRYADGRVTPADEYYWVREGDRNGQICSETHDYPTPYKIQTVFSCNPFLPIVVADGDISVPPDDGQRPRWEFLTFVHASSTHTTKYDISLAVGKGSHGGGRRRYVAGSAHSWVPSLVPKGFVRRRAGSSPSRGLGGELPIVLALMSFYEPLGATQEERMENVFYGENARWSGGIWRGSHEPRGYSNDEDTPNGFVVYVFLDNLHNPYGSTPEALELFESGVIVRG